MTIRNCLEESKSKIYYGSMISFSTALTIGLKKGIEAFDKYNLWALIYAAVADIAQFGLRYREEPV